MNWKPIKIDSHRKINRKTCIIEIDGKEHYVSNDSIKFVIDEGWFIKENVKLESFN